MVFAFAHIVIQKFLEYLKFQYTQKYVHSITFIQNPIGTIFSLYISIQN